MIHYKAGYKYQLVREFTVQTSVQPAERIETQYISLDLNGLLIIKPGYAWDGPSGPTIDTKNFMRGSLVHDTMYQLLRMSLLDPACREDADDDLRRLCLEDGMSAIRAWYVWRSVRRLAAGAADTDALKPVLTAP